MRAKLIILAFLAIGLRNYSQTIYEAPLPNDVKQKCEEVIISEIGKNTFATHVKYIKTDVLKGAADTKYTVFYSFNFPNVKESHVVFSLDYQAGKGIVKDAAFKNHTRLPGSIKKDGAKVLSFEAAKKLAIASDTILKKHSDKVYGEISSDYDTEKKDYYFVWHFYHLEPCKKCEAEMYTTQSAYINASTGKVLRNVESRQ